MKNVIIIFFQTILLNFNVYSQKEDYQWIFGDSCGIDFSNPASPIAFMSDEYNMYENASSISDAQGHLKLYLNGSPTVANNFTFYSTVYSSHHLIVINGDSIMSDYSETQGSLIVPFPGHPDQYYLFHIQWDPYQAPPYTNSLYYTVIDMSANNGFGRVISKNNLLIHRGTQEKVCGVKHGNGRDWWICSHLANSSEFKIYLLTPGGIVDSVTQSIGPVIPDSNYCLSAGQMKFSSQGDKLAITNLSGVLGFFNFDRCNGLFTNYTELSSLNVICTGYYGCSFSPSGNLLYASAGSDVFQYNLTSQNIPATRFTVWHDTSNFLESRPGQHLLGPDGKIYISCLTGFPVIHHLPQRFSLSVINDPEIPGAGCNFLPYSFNLNGGESCGGLPNMCNYSLGSLGSCDTLTTVSDIPGKINILIYPTLAIDVLNIIDPKNLQKEIIIYDTYSRKVYSNCFNGSFEPVNISILRPGLYYVSIRTKEGNLIQKFIKGHH